MNDKSLEMTEEEFKAELRGSLLLLSTSSPDKRNIFREYFSSHDLHKDDDGHLKHGGIDVFFTDSGAVKLPPRKTPEMTGTYEENLAEKCRQQIAVLKQNDAVIRSQLVEKGDVAYLNKFDSKSIKIIGMTEDSGWKIDFEDKKTEKEFVNKIIEKLEPKIRKRDSWLLEKLHGEKEGFPGPNLKPFQEHLAGGFSEMMDMIYETAKGMGIEKLRFKNFSNVAFASPQTGKIFLKNFESGGDIITREEYNDKLRNTKHGEAVNSNFIHIPDGQKDGAHDTIDTLIKKGLHNKSTQDLPASYARRDLTEYLQKLIGKRRTTREERSRSVHVAFANPDYMDGGKYIDVSSPAVHDYKISGIPNTGKLLENQHLKAFDNADVIVLVPKKIEANKHALQDDSNYRMLTNFVTTTEIDPQSMNVPLLLDNRTGCWNEALKLFTDEFAQGRLKGDMPFYIANNDQEMRDTLVILKDIKQRAPLIKKSKGEEESDNVLSNIWEKFKEIKSHLPFLKSDSKDNSEENKDGKLSRVWTAIKMAKQSLLFSKHSELEGLMQEVSPPLAKLPSDGVFSLFIAGGHANNSKRDLEEGKSLGYHCAEKNWRIVTGGGAVEGSMGSIHTGFIQFHLDHLQDTNKLSEEVKKKLAKYKGDDGKYDAENVILKEPDSLNELADKGLIPRDRFYCYSTKPLLEMESPSGKPAPATTYFDAGNYVRRLDALMQTGTKVFLPGAIGTDDELALAIKQRLDAVAGKYNGKTFTDGTPDNDGQIIIYNRNHHMDNLLRHYGLTGKNGEEIKNKHNIMVINDDIEQIKSKTSEVAKTWQERLESDRQKGTSAGIA